ISRTGARRRLRGVRNSCWRIARRESSARRLGVRAEDRVDQARETAVQVVLAQAHEALGALDPLGDDPGLAQGAEVVGEGGLAGAQPGLLDDLSTPRLTVRGQELYRGQRVRVGQRGQHPRQLKVLSCWL